MPKKTDLIRKFIDDYPNITADRRRAIMLCELYPDEFKDIELTRGYVRTIVGKHGDTERRKFSDPELIKYFRSSLPDIVAPPQTDNSAYIIPEERMVVWNDLHGPWFDKSATERALAESDADTLYLNGDVADYYWISRYPKTPQAITNFNHELEKIKEFLSWVRDKFDTVYYKLANHEDRLAHYIQGNVPQLATLQTLTTESLLNFTELGIKVVGTHQHAEFDDLDLIHGHEVRVMGGVNLGISYAKAWQGFKGRMDVKVMAAHHHRFNYGVINNPDGSKAYGWVNGALCQRAVGYAPKNNWQHGITHVTKTSKGVIVEPLMF
jgi:hypothetical protein